MSDDIIVPICFFGAVIACVWLINHFNYKKRDAAHETIRLAITNGQPVSSELIEKLTMATDPAHADMRRGVLFVAVGIAIFVLGLVIASTSNEPVTPVLGIASFPITIGIAYLGLWWTSRKDKTD